MQERNSREGQKSLVSSSKYLSMISVAQNLAWGLLVTLSFAALGRIIARVAWPSDPRDFFLAAGWGMAGMVILGGVLNLLGLATSSGLVTLVLALISLDILVTWRGPRSTREGAPSPTGVAPAEPSERWGSLWILLVVLFGAFKYASSLTVEFNEPDDQPAYLLQCARLLQTGSIGSDPFSDRQLLSLNGQTFLLGVVCAVSPMKCAFLLDPGICWILLGGLTWSIIRRELGGSIRDASLFTGLMFLVKIPFINLSGYLTGAVLYLTLIRTSHLGIGDKKDLDKGALLMLALTVAGLCALKTTYLYYAGLFVATWFGLRMFVTSGFVLARELSLIGLMTSIFLLPWMWQQYLSAGTALYPFLGKGFHISGAGLEIFGDSLTVKAKAAIYYLASGHAVPALFGLLLLAAKPFEGDEDRWRVLLASLFSASAGSVALSFYMASTSIVRYTVSFLFAALIPVGLFGFFSPRPSRSRLALALCLAGFVGLSWENLHTTLARLVEFIEAPGPGRLHNDRDPNQIRQAQTAIPPGERILASVQHGYLLDFARNPIWNLDQGMTSPPPGMPVSLDWSALRGFLGHTTTEFPPPCPSEDLLSYLRHVGIDFVIFQRGKGTVWYTRDVGPPNKSKSYQIRMIFTIRKLVSEELNGLQSKCKVVHDDGDIVVFDLRSPSAGSGPGG